MRAALIPVLALAALPAPPALAWEELSFRTLPGGSPAGCLRAAGGEGGLAALSPRVDRATPVDLLAAGVGPPVVRDRARFKLTVDCPVLREQGDVAVAAVPDFNIRGRTAMAVAVRDAGGSFGRPARLGRATLTGDSYDVAVSARGDAVVAWVQADGAGKQPRVRIVAARRAPGSAFGTVERLTPWARASSVEPFLSVAAGMDDAGGVTVAWAAPAGRGGDDVEVAAAGAAPRAAFGAPQVLTRRADSLARVSLAVTPDGVALLAHDGVKRGGTRLFERPAGAAVFGSARELASAQPDTLLGTSDPALALRGAGAAVVAWRDDGDDGMIRAMTRPPGGSFGPSRAVAPGRAQRAVALDESPGYTDEPDLGLSVALSGDGRAMVAWSAPRRLPDTPVAPLAATGTLTEGVGTATVLGSSVRATGVVTTLVLAGGEPAVAWADNSSTAIGIGGSTLETSLREGRIHVARAGAAAGPATPPPVARIRAPRVQRLSRDQGVRVRVRCQAACDVRAHLRARHGPVVAQGASLPAAGVRAVVVKPGIGALVGRRPRRVVLRVRVAAPGSPVARTLRLGLRLVRR